MARAQIDENVRDPKLPGNSLLDAILNRRLMSWSDRGGASQYIGNCWAQHCANKLAGMLGEGWPIPGAGSFELACVIRLDESDNVEREANANQLKNPDFVLIGRRNAANCGIVMQPADAKFAANRVKPEQISAEALEKLIKIPDRGATRHLVESALQDLGFAEPTIVEGVFISPESTLTDYFLRQVTRGRSPKVTPNQMVTFRTRPDLLFAELPASRLVGNLARLDRLSVSPRENLLSAIYYFRVACACLYFWSEAHLPLLGPSGTNPDIHPEVAGGEVAARARGAHSAFEVLNAWNEDLRSIQKARKSLADAARLPVSMKEIRQRVSNAVIAEQKLVVREIRKCLEIAFRRRLADQVGTIYPGDPRSLDQILRVVGKAARDLRNDMRALLDNLIEQHRN